MRYKEFNQNKVLNDCISLFWNNSFNGTPISAIVDHTRVNRYSLYHEFENKQGILYAALRLYEERYSSKSIKMLGERGDVSDVLENFYFSYLKNDRHPIGCFLIYIATELADNNPLVNALLNAYLTEIETTFVSLLNTSNKYAHQSKLISSNLVFLFCNSMCYCHIQGEKESQEYISLNLDIILNN
jgi:AcrR family transcriptional regulator